MLDPKGARVLGVDAYADEGGGVGARGAPAAQSSIRRLKVDGAARAAGSVGCNGFDLRLVNPVEDDLGRKHKLGVGRGGSAAHRGEL